MIKHASLFVALGFVAGCETGLTMGSLGQETLVCSNSGTNLMAGQSINVGTVNVTQTEGDLCVEFVITDPEWYITETHLAIATDPDLLPQTGSGNPQVGQFPYSDSGLHTQSSLFCIDYVAAGYAANTELFLAAHAVVVREGNSGQVVQSETAWGEGTGFSGRSWAMYFNHTLSECVPPNAPPTASAGIDQSLTCVAPGQSEVTLDGTGSTDPDGDALTYSWQLGGIEIATGATAVVNLPDGTNVITLVVTDPSGESASDEVTVVVEADTQAPQVVAINSMIYMQYPRSWALEPFTLADCVAAASDECSDVDVNTNGNIVSISSDEAVITANHNCTTDPLACTDIQILDNSTFTIRNTRDSYGNGRVYTVTFTLADDAGNTTAPLTCQFGVRLWGTHIPVAGAPSYTVYP